MKKFLSILMSILLICVAFVGCTNQEQNVPNTDAGNNKEENNKQDDANKQEKPGKKDLHYAFLDEPPGIDPGVSQGDTQSSIYGALYEGLVSTDAEGNIVPGVAKEWKVSDDGKEYTFTLRDGLKWSDGQPLTAKDFEYAWLRVLNPETASTYSWFVEMFLENSSEYMKGEMEASEVGVKAVDDKTLVVKLKTPASYFLQALQAGCWLPVRQDIVEANSDTWSLQPESHISNGPFKFVEYKIGSYIQVEKNENYWNAENIKLNSIKFSFIIDPNTALAALEKNDVDGIAGVPAAELVNLITTDDRVHLFDKLSFNFLRLNTETEGLNNPDVRRAISLAIDRTAYLEATGGISSTPALGCVPSGIILNGKDFRENAGNNGLDATAKIDEAKELLTKAGYPNGEGLPVYRLHCAESSVKSAEVIQEMLSTNLGIKTEIKPVDAKLNFPMMVDGKYDIAFGGWGGDYNHPMTFLELFTSTAYDNCTRWANSEYDQLINDARNENDEAKALELLTKAENLITLESPIVPLGFPSGCVMIQEYVKNWSISPSNKINFNYSYMEE